MATDDDDDDPDPPFDEVFVKYTAPTIHRVPLNQTESGKEW